jgi:threonine/homoserine/homoserine lactone efflux protein
MKQSLKVFYWGMMISFLGSLPPGMMNIAGTQIFRSKGTGEAFFYVTGFMLAEMILVRITLSGMNRLIRNQKFFHFLEWITAAMMVIISISCFISANSMEEVTFILPGLVLPSFLLGIVISVLNPMHIPFWLGWSTVLINKGILTTRSRQYNIYITGIATGTIAGFAVFISGGQYLLQIFQSNQFLLNCVIGFVLLIAAFFHVKKMIFVPASVRHAKLFRRS